MPLCVLPPAFCFLRCVAPLLPASLFCLALRVLIMPSAELFAKCVSRCYRLFLRGLVYRQIFDAPWKKAVGTACQERLSCGMSPTVGQAFLELSLKHPVACDASPAKLEYPRQRCSSMLSEMQQKMQCLHMVQRFSTASALPTRRSVISGMGGT